MTVNGVNPTLREQLSKLISKLDGTQPAAVNGSVMPPAAVTLTFDPKI